MASDQLRGGSDDTSAEAEGKLPPVVMFAFPESSLSLSSRKKGQSHPHWHLLSFLPHSLLPVSYSYKEPAAQGKSLADSAPRTEWVNGFLAPSPSQKTYSEGRPDVPSQPQKPEWLRGVQH